MHEHVAPNGREIVGISLRDLATTKSHALAQTSIARGGHRRDTYLSVLVVLREHIRCTMESRGSFYPWKRYRLRAFTVRTRKIDREEVVREHKDYLPPFFISVFTCTKELLGLYVLCSIEAAAHVFEELINRKLELEPLTWSRSAVAGGSFDYKNVGFSYIINNMQHHFVREDIVVL